LLASDRRVALALDLPGRTSLTKPCAVQQTDFNPASAEGAMPGSGSRRKRCRLSKLPLCTNNPRDGGPYITGRHVIIRDPEFGNNLAIYRMMLVSKNESPSLHPRPRRPRLHQERESAARRNSKLRSASACRRQSMSRPIRAAAAFMNWRLRAVWLAKLWMSSSAGPSIWKFPRWRKSFSKRVDDPAKTGDEGPFGEFCGYTTNKCRRANHEDQGDHHRRNPVYHNIWLGKPPHEHLYVDALTYAVAAYQELKPAYPALKKAYAPPGAFPSCCFCSWKNASCVRASSTISGGFALYPQRKMETCFRRRRRHRHGRSQ